MHLLCRGAHQGAGEGWVYVGVGVVVCVWGWWWWRMTATEAVHLLSALPWLSRRRQLHTALWLP
jgi:hypothetical protein